MCVCSNSRRPRRDRGFTLLEVIVAFTILAFAMTALVQAFSSGLRGLSVAEASTAAVMHARAKLEEVGSVIPVQEGEASGTYDDGFDWRVVVTPFDVGEDRDFGSGLIAYLVEVTVAAPGAPEITLRGLRLGPPEE